MEEERVKSKKKIGEQKMVRNIRRLRRRKEVISKTSKEKKKKRIICRKYKKITSENEKNIITDKKIKRK